MITPIPLTEQLLLKFGFAWDDADPIQQGRSLFLNINGRITIVFYLGNSSNLSLEQDGKLIDFPSGIVKYVHQLQNLYFALTGEELKQPNDKADASTPKASEA